MRPCTRCLHPYTHGDYGNIVTATVHVWPFRLFPWHAVVIGPVQLDCRWRMEGRARGSASCFQHVARVVRSLSSLPSVDSFVSRCTWPDGRNGDKHTGIGPLHRLGDQLLVRIIQSKYYNNMTLLNAGRYHFRFAWNPDPYEIKTTVIRVASRVPLVTVQWSNSSGGEQTAVVHQQQ